MNARIESAWLFLAFCLQWLRDHWRIALIWMGIGAAVVLLWLSVSQRSPAADPVLSTPEPVVAGVATEPVALRDCTAQAYPDPVKQKLPIPLVAKASTQLKAVAAVRIGADDHANTVTTLLNTDTGGFTSYTAQEPHPFAAVDSTGSAGIYYGWANGAPAIRGDIRQGVFRLKAAHIGLIGSIDQPLGGARSPSTFLGGGAWGVW